MDLLRPLGRPLGQLVNSRRIGRFAVSESIYEPDCRLPAHAHEAPYICAVLAGRFSERYGARTRTCGVGTAVVHPRGEVHSERFGDEPARCLNVELAARDDALESLLRNPLEGTGGPAARLALRIRSELADSDPLAALVIEALALELLVTLARGETERPSSSPPRWLRAVREAVEDDPDRPPGLGPLAAVAGVHPSHLAREFRRYFGLTVGGYVRRLRIERACHALTTTRTPIAEIALSCGFVDQSHFTRTFRRVSGTTPARYRALQGKG